MSHNIDFKTLRFDSKDDNLYLLNGGVFLLMFILPGRRELVGGDGPNF